MKVDAGERTNEKLILRLFWPLCGIAATLLMCFDNPGFLDYPNHLARFYVMTRDFHTAFYEKFYVDNFRLLPNVGVDAIMFVVGRVVPAALGLKLVLASTVALYCLGFLKLHRRVSGVTSPLVLLIPMTAYSYTLFLGFVNSFLGFAVLPWAYLCYLSYKPQPRWYLSLGLYCLALFYCHFFTFLVLVFLILVSTVFNREIPLRKVDYLFLFGILVTGLGLYKLSPTSIEQTVIQWSTVAEKVKYFFAPFVFGPFWYAGTILFFAIVGGLFLSRKIELGRSGRTVLISLLVLFILCPYGLSISGNFDGRLPSLIFAFLFAFARVPVIRVSQVAAVCSLTTLIHLGTSAVVMNRSTLEAQKVRRILADVPTGAILACKGINTSGATHRNTWYPNYNMIQFVAVPERSMHVAGTFSFPSQQPVLVNEELRSILSIPANAGKGSIAEVQRDYDRWRSNVQLGLPSKGIESVYVLLIDFKSLGASVLAVDEVIYKDETYTLLRCDLVKR